MANPTELDLFRRSLAGDRRARTELYKKYVHGSSRVSRLASGYSSYNDFLHDTYNNLLRTGHSWDSEESLTRWVESVAVWTALINERQRDMHARGAQGEIRMCAEVEGEDVVHGEVLAAYAPPLLGMEDSPAARVLALLSGDERTIFQKRAIENASWEATAIAAGKPLNAVGQIFARLTTRLSRLFGAPPLMDDDLVPVVSRVFAKPMKPEGRAISLQLDNAFYSLSPEMQAIGLKTAYEARMVVLWDAAQQSVPPAEPLRAHLDKCHYCADLLRALILMQQALATQPGIPFLLCPGAFNLANAPDLVHEAFDQHLAQCPACRTERTRALDGDVTSETDEQDPTQGVRKRLAWAVAAILILALGSFAAYRYSASRRADATTAEMRLTSDKPHATVAIDPRYKDLVRDVPLDEARVLASVLPAHRAAVKFALNQFSLNNVSQALMVSEKVAQKGDDPGAQMLYAMSLFKTKLMTDAYREMLKSEAMAPRQSMRCWIMLQFALVVGDRPVIEREAQHLAKDPEYAARVKDIIARVRARG